MSGTVIAITMAVGVALVLWRVILLALVSLMIALIIVGLSTVQAAGAAPSAPQPSIGQQTQNQLPRLDTPLPR